MATGTTASITLQANVDQFNAAMRTAAAQTEQAMQRMERGAASTKAAMLDLVQGGIAGALASVSVGALATMAKSAIDGMDALNDLADATGASIEKISALEDVAARTGANFDTVSSAMLKFNKLLIDAKPGSEAEAGLKALGLEAAKLKDMDLADAMLEYARSLDKFADDGNKARLVMDQTGKSVKELAPFLKDLAEQHELVASVTTQQAEEAEKFNKELFNMQKNAVDLARYLSSDLVSAINNTVKAFRDGRAAGQGFIETAAKRYMDNVREFYGITKPGSNSASGKLEEPETKQPDKPSVVVPPPKKPPGPARSSGAAKDPDADFKAYMKNLENQIAKVNELTFSEKLLFDIRNGTLTVGAGQQAQLLAIANEIDATKEAVRISTERQTLRKKDEQDSINAMREIEAETARQTQVNLANVEQIRIGLMSELGQETLAHELRLEELQKFHDSKLENVTQANALIEAENARHEQTKADLQASYQMQGLNMASSSADQLYSLMQKAGMEQTALGKAVFLASKALAIAEIIINTEVAAAKATAMFPVYGVAIATGIRVAGYASAGLVAGMAIAEVSAEGGYDIPAGKNPVAQLHEKEMVLPKAQADVIRGLASGGGASGGGDKITIINQTTGRIDNVVEQRISPTERALIIQESVKATAAQFGDPNSQTSRALSRNYSTQRSR